MIENPPRPPFDAEKVLSSSPDIMPAFNELLALCIPDEKERSDVNAKFHVACRQMSQLVAWTWLDDAETEEEKELKERFTQALKNQAEHNQLLYSQEISNLLSGEEPQGKLTLPEQYKKLVKEFQEYVYTPQFVEYFYFKVVKNQAGYFDFDEDKPDRNNSKIIVGLAYPDRPELDESQLNELRDWATGDSGGGWKPPQDWISLASL